jgi:hypothetical protein
MRITIWLTLAACGIHWFLGVALVQATAASDALPVLVTTHAPLEASLQRIERRSPRWRSAVGAIQSLGRQVFVLTPDQVKVAEAIGERGTAPFDRDLLAAASPVVDGETRIQRVLVVVNLDLLQDLHDRTNSLQGEFEADLDALLVHEVYGHAFPYLLAGDLSGQCADPGPGQRPQDACSIRRENDVRQDLGLARRATYGLNALHLVRGRF